MEATVVLLVSFSIDFNALISFIHLVFVNNERV